MEAVKVANLKKHFHQGKLTALDGLSAHFPKGKLTGIVGPDGAGKTTLLRLISGLMLPDEGSIELQGKDLELYKGNIYDFLSYLPQELGIYEDLTVRRNMKLYAALQSVPQDSPVLQKLLKFSGLEPFLERLAGNLSGGMKQKLGLACVLLKSPQILLLDGPTVGIDPLAQQDLWSMFLDLKKEGVTIGLATSYLEEAERCDHVLLLNEGKLLFSGPPSLATKSMEGRVFHIQGLGIAKRKELESLLEQEIISDATILGDDVRITLQHPQKKISAEELHLENSLTIIPVAPRFEDVFVNYLGGVKKRPTLHYSKTEAKGYVVEAIGLSKTFGEFKAVENVNFALNRGEIFGLLGPNGAGKSTTFKMLCGLLKPSEGEATVCGFSLRNAPREARRKFGYMAQKFSLYENMSVLQNLRFFAGAYQVPSQDDVINEMLNIFELAPYRKILANDLPFGYKQRLALCCSLMHQPEVIFLDEPTSGIDPLTRREFWHQINALSDKGVTTLVTTHLMEEAEFCDRIGIIFKGRLKLIDTPANLKAKARTIENPHPTLQDAFIQFCRED